MDCIGRLADLMPSQVGQEMQKVLDFVSELRLRVDRPAEIVCAGEGKLVGEAVGREEFDKILLSLMENSRYAWENELKQGFFTLEGGHRAGVCFTGAVKNGSVQDVLNINAVCIRIARAQKGCADELLSHVINGRRVVNTLILSPPGMGKTTLLRDVVRSLSCGGYRVALCDERGEIAACRRGVPALDVGPRTDVMDLCPAQIVLPGIIRSMAPQVIAMDEIGSPADARNIAEAGRCGVSIIATAHAASVQDALGRSSLNGLVSGGVFELAVVLGEKPGRIVDLHRLKGPGKGR